MGGHCYPEFNVIHCVRKKCPHSHIITAADIIVGYFWPSTCSTCDQLIFIGVSYEMKNWILQILWGNDLKFDCLTNHILSLRSYTLPSCSSIWITSKSCKGLWFLLIKIIVSTWPSDDKQTKLLVVTKAILYWDYHIAICVSTRDMTGGLSVSLWNRQDAMITWWLLASDNVGLSYLSF